MGTPRDWLQAVGIPESDWGYVNFIINHEGGWDGVQKWNHAGSGAYGICQSLPHTKMATAGPDYMTNPITQLKWCDSYAKSRYGGWFNAYQAWLSQSWW